MIRRALTSPSLPAVLGMAGALIAGAGFAMSGEWWTALWCGIAGIWAGAAWRWHVLVCRYQTLVDSTLELADFYRNRLALELAGREAERRAWRAHERRDR